MLQADLMAKHSLPARLRSGKILSRGSYLPLFAPPVQGQFLFVDRWVLQTELESFQQKNLRRFINFKIVIFFFFVYYFN